MKTSMKKYMDPQKNIIAERYKFNKRERNSEESVSDFIVEIKGLSQSCDFGDFLDSALRDKLVCGVNHNIVQSKLLSESRLTFEEACKIARGIETTSSDLQTLRGEAQVNKVGVFARTRLGPRPDDNKRQNKVARYQNYQCYSCSGFGHTQKYCFRNKDNNQLRNDYNRNRVENKNRRHNNSGTRQKFKQRINEIASESEEEELSFNHLASITEAEAANDMARLHHVANTGPELIEVSINKVKVVMEIDSGACHSVMHIEDKLKYFSNEKIKEFATKLTVVTGQAVKIVGYIDVCIKKPNSTITHTSKVIIIDGEKRFIPLCGRTFLDLLFPGWRTFFSDESISAVQQLQQRAENFDTNVFLSKIKKEYKTVFSTNSDQPIKNFKVQIHLIEGAKPIFYKPYSMAYGIREKAEKEFKRLCDLNIMYPVRQSKWATPIIPVPKPNNAIRICADCKVTLNKFLKKDHYPLPRFDDLMAGLANAKYFCVLDLRDAFQQIEIAEESQELFTVNTHVGLFRYRRLFLVFQLLLQYFRV